MGTLKRKMVLLLKDRTDKKLRVLIKETIKERGVVVLVLIEYFLFEGQNSVKVVD
uniref:Uncharacterized protein n=1 Tax=Lepeophtheirus salmonis TaxID=72036 RepID=A0A0K2ULG9_LEPSM